MGKEKLFHAGVKALITNDEGKILVFEVDTSGFEKKTAAHGDLPGGRIDWGEGPMDCLKREMLEETGITEYGDVEFFTASVSSYEIPLRDGTDTKVGLVLLIYKVRVANDVKIVMSDEHLAYDWLDVKDAAKSLELKFTKEFTDVLLRDFETAA